MKNSFKIIALAIALFSFLSLRSYAQTTTASTSASYGSGIRLSAGADGGLPIGSLRQYYNWNLGGSLQGDFPIINDQLYATLNGGYDNYFAKKKYNLPDIHLIPVKAGLKFFPVKFVYLQGEAGVSFITNKSSLGFNKNASFVYAPQVGTLLNIGGRNYIDAGFRFESNTKFYDGGKSNNILALRVAYSFGL
jgi:hypothetical protein